MSKATQLYRTAQELEGVAQIQTLNEVRHLFEEIVENYPKTAAAVRVSSDEGLGFIDRELVFADRWSNESPGTLPRGWGPRAEAEVQDLLSAYTNDLGDIERIADSADYAILAWAAYQAPQALRLAKIRGWIPMETIADENHFSGDNAAELFINKYTRQSVLAFRGTDDPKFDPLDWVTNIQSGVAALPEVREQLSGAVALSIERHELNNEIIFVGHSLGGRLAQLSNRVTGAKAFAFNSASMSAGDPLWTVFDAVAYPESVERFRAPDDIVSMIRPGPEIDTQPWDQMTIRSFQDYSSAPAQASTEVPKSMVDAAWEAAKEALFASVAGGMPATVADLLGEIPIEKVLYDHSIEELALEMARVRDIRDSGWIDYYLHIQGEPKPSEERAQLEVGLSKGLYTIDPALCSVVDAVGDAWGTLFQSVAVSSVQRGAERVCAVQTVTFDGDVVSVEAECEVEGANEEESWTWKKLSNASFEEIKGRYAGNVYALCGAPKDSASHETEEAEPAPAPEEGYTEPERGDAIHASLLAAVRPLAEEKFGAPVQFVVETMRVGSNRAYVELWAQRPEGRPIDLAAVSDSGDPRWVSGFLRYEGGTWVAYDIVFGATEAWWIGDCTGLETLMPETCEEIAPIANQTTPVGDGLYVQSHSRRNFDEAYQLAKQLAAAGAPNVNVFEAANGWFAVTVERLPSSDATDARLQSIIANYELPDDSIYTRGDRFVELRASFEGHATRPDIAPVSGSREASIQSEPSSQVPTQKSQAAAAAASAVVTSRSRDGLNTSTETVLIAPPSPSYPTGRGLYIAWAFPDYVGPRRFRLAEKGYVQEPLVFKPLVLSNINPVNIRSIANLERESVLSLLEESVLGGMFVTSASRSVGGTFDANISLKPTLSHQAVNDLANSLLAAIRDDDDFVRDAFTGVLLRSADSANGQRDPDAGMIRQALGTMRLLDRLGYRAIYFYQDSAWKLGGSDIWVNTYGFGVPFSTDAKAFNLPKLTVPGTPRSGFLTKLISIDEVLGVFEDGNTAEVEFSLKLNDLTSRNLERSTLSFESWDNNVDLFIKDALSLGFQTHSVLRWPSRGLVEEIVLKDDDLKRIWTATFRNYDDGWRLHSIR